MEALVLSVQVFGVSAAQVYQAEQQCAGRAEVVAVLAAVLTGAQRQDARVRPALEVWQREQRELLLGQWVWTSDQRALPLEVWRREERAMFHPHRHLSHEANNTTGPLPAGAPDAKVRTARQAVLLSLC